MKLTEILDSLAEIYSKTTEKTEEALIILRSFGNADTILVQSSINKELKIFSNSDYEIKIPNKYKIGTTVIWDCYCLETTDSTQGLINKFFIKKLSETTERLKFVILTPESSIIKRHVEFSYIIESFISVFTFPKPEELKNSLSLIITKAKSSSELAKFVEPLKNKNKAVKEFLENLSSPASIKIFYKHPLQSEPLIVETIIENLNTAKVTINHFPLKLKTYEEAEHLWFLIEVNVAAINDTITLTFNKENFDYYQPLNCHIFFDNYDDNINQFLLTSNKNHTPLFSNKAKHFQGLQQIFEFHTLMKVDNEDSKSVIIKLLDIIEKFVSTPQQQKQIHNYSYVFKQLTEYILFFEEVLSQSFSNDLFKKVINHCKETINKIFMPLINSIKLADSKDVIYYKNAITWLDKYEAPKEVTNTKALAYFNIGKILSKKGELISAWLNFNNALKCNEKLTFIYIKIGNIVFKLGHEKLAIKYFKVVGKTKKILQCFNSLIEKNPLDIKTPIQKGDFLLEQRSYDEALKSYKYAENIAANEAQRSEAMIKTLQFWISRTLSNTNIIKYDNILEGERDKDFTNIIGKNYASDNYEYIN